MSTASARHHRDEAAVHVPGVADAVFITCLLVVAWVCYQPHVAPPFDYVDFPENLLVLQSHEGFRAGFSALTGVYREHGRWSPVTLALLSAQWSLFGTWAPGWYLARFVLLSGVTVLAYALFRRLRLNATGAFAAALLLVVAPAAITGWTRLSTAEPVGMIFLVLASHLALERRRRLTSIGMAAMLLCLMATKEFMTVAFVFPAILAVAGNDHGNSGRMNLSRRIASRLIPSALVFALVLVPIVRTYASAPEGSFASRYGAAGIQFQDVVGGWLMAWLPFAPVAGGAPPIALLLVAVLLTLVVAGWHAGYRAGPGHSPSRLILRLAIGLPIIGSLAYAPWPFYLPVYALPFLLAGSLLFGQAASSLADSGKAGRIAGGVCLTLILSFSIAQAANEAGRTRSVQNAVATSVSHVASLTGIDTVLVAVATEQFDSSGNFGPRFSTYARFLGLQWPTVRDVTCADTSISTSSRTLLVRLSAMCEGASREGTATTFRYSRFQWPDPRPRRDSVTVAFIRPPRQSSHP